MGDSLWCRLGDRRVQPTELARGPWVDDALHGGPVAALLSHLCEQAEPADADAMQPVRLCLELLAPVPLTPLDVHVEIVRPGRQIRLVEATLRADGRLLATARLAEMRSKSVTLPPSTQDLEGDRTVAAAMPDALDRAESPWNDDQVRFHSHAVDVRFAEGAWGLPGPATAWVQLETPVFVDQPISPLVAVASAADFPNGISAPLSSDGHLFINSEVTFHLHRLPTSAWVGVAASCFVEPNGIGMSDAVLFDRVGRIGRSNQSLLIDRR